MNKDCRRIDYRDGLSSGRGESRAPRAFQLEDRARPTLSRRSVTLPPAGLGAPMLLVGEFLQVHASAEKRVRPPIRPMQVLPVLRVPQPDAARDVRALDRQSLASRKLPDFRDAHHEAELGSPLARVNAARCAFAAPLYSSRRHDPNPTTQARF